VSLSHGPACPHSRRDTDHRATWTLRINRPDQTSIRSRNPGTLASIASNESDQPFGCRLPLGSPLSPARRRPGGAVRTSSFLRPVVAVRAAGRLARGRPSRPVLPVSPQSSGKMGRAAKQPKRGHAVRRLVRRVWAGRMCSAPGPGSPTHGTRPPAILTTVVPTPHSGRVWRRSHVAEPRNVLARTLGRELDLDSFVRAVPISVSRGRSDGSQE